MIANHISIYQFCDNQLILTMMDDWFLKALLLHVPLLWIGGGKFQSVFNNGKKLTYNI